MENTERNYPWYIIEIKGDNENCKLISQEVVLINEMNWAGEKPIKECSIRGMRDHNRTYAIPLHIAEEEGIELDDITCLRTEYADYCYDLLEDSGNVIELGEALNETGEKIIKIWEEPIVFKEEIEKVLEFKKKKDELKEMRKREEEEEEEEEE